MNTHFFAGAVGRWIAPAVLAATTFCGTLGVSSVASADERVEMAPAVEVVAAAPRVVRPGVVVETGVARECVARPGYVLPGICTVGYRGPVVGHEFWGYGRGFHAGYGVRPGFEGRPGFVHGAAVFHGGRR